MQSTSPVSRESKIYETLNFKDDSMHMQDLDFFGPWHKQNNSIQQQIAQIRKTYTSSSNHIQNDILERPETQTSQFKYMNTSFPKKRRTRKTSIDQSSQFVDRPKYDESRQVQRIIKEFFAEELKEKKKEKKIFVPPSKSYSNTKCAGPSFQSTQEYFDKIAFKMMKLMPNLPKSAQKTAKLPKQQGIPKKLILDMPMSTKSYFPPQLLITSTKPKSITPQNQNNPPKNQFQNLHFLAKTGKAPVWRFNNYTSL